MYVISNTLALKSVRGKRINTTFPICLMSKRANVHSPMNSKKKVNDNNRKV